MMNHLQIKRTTYRDELVSIQTIRRLVFQEEQGVTATLEFDGQDETADHLLSDLNGQPVGTARIRKLDRQTAKIERLAVLPTARGKGIGKKLMGAALDAIAQDKQVEKVVINAQEYVTGLYEKLGFQQIGDRFDEAGIPHVKMVKRLVH
ncbi:MAG: GNAT family N-acetyltransferase [Microcystaceae cyanobacterium]